MTVALIALLTLQSQPQIDAATMAKCYALYKKYEIALPPLKAPVVVMRDYKGAPTMGFLVKDNGFISSFDEGNVQVGYQLAELMPPRPTKPTDELIDTCTLVFDRYTVPVATGVADAMALYDHGYKRLATRLMQRAIDSPPHGTFGDFPKGTNALTAVSYTALALNLQLLPRYLSFSFGKDDDDDYLKSVKQIFDIEKDPVFQKKRVLVDEIISTFSSKGKADTNVVGQIDSMIRSHSVFWPRPGWPHSGRTEPFDNPTLGWMDGYYLDVARRGLAIVPSLIKHLDDNRITRAIQLSEQGSVEYCTIGMLCRRILNTFFGSNAGATAADYQKWYAQITNKNGKEWTNTDNAAFAFSKLTADGAPFKEELLSLLPDEQLPALLQTYRERNDVPLEPVVDAMLHDGFLRTKLPLTTINAFKDLAADKDYRKSMLGVGALRVAANEDWFSSSGPVMRDPAARIASDNALVAAIQQLDPSTIDTSDAKALAAVGDALARTSNFAVWNAYIDAVAKMPPQARALLIYDSSISSNGWRQADQYPRFARHFFDDQTPIPDVMAMYGETKAEFGDVFVPKTIGQLALHCSAIVIGVSYPVEHDRPDLLRDLRKWVDEQSAPAKKTTP